MKMEKGMSDTETARAVAAFYTRHPFPGIRKTDADGLLLMRRVAKCVVAGKGTSPDTRTRLLDAGCGTGNSAVALARAFPSLDVLGFDVCRRSLDLGSDAARAERLENVRFMEGDLLTGVPAGPWDIILCMGVLHHTAHMGRALANLARELAPDGRMLLWVYGRHGRYHHRLNRDLLALLLEDGLEPARQVELARDFARDTRDGQPLRELYGFVPGNHDREQVVLGDAWVADQFLHVNEQVVDLPELLDLLDGAGLALREWLGEDLSGSELPPALRRRLERLPSAERLKALDLLIKPPRYFVEAGTKGPGSA
jgi:SAM-dependent methyltransferase